MIFDRWRGAIGTRNTVGLVDTAPVKRSELTGVAKVIQCRVWTPVRVELPVEAHDFRTRSAVNPSQILGEP